MRYYRDRYQKGKGKKLVLWSIFIALGIPLLLVSSAQGQIRENIERELKRTDVVIRRAKEAVLESRNPKAENLLLMATNLQGKAKEAFSMIKYRLALQLTLKGREKAYEAIGFTKRDEENENLVLKVIERTDQIINKAKEVVGELRKRRLASLLQMAIDNQQKAKEFFKEHKPKMALKLSLKAKEMAQRILTMAKGEKRVDRLAEKELKKTDELTQKTWLIVQESQDQKAKKLFDRSTRLQEKAWNLFHQGRFTGAIKESRKARELVRKALRAVEENVTPQLVKNAIQQNERLIERGTKEINASSNLKAEKAFNQGLSHQSKAKEYWEKGKFKAALAEAKVARRLITKALEMIQAEGI